MAKRTRRPPTRREKLYAALDELDPAAPAQALERIELWLGAILAELGELNDGLGMVLNGDVEFGASADDLAEAIETLRARRSPGNRGGS